MVRSSMGALTGAHCLLLNGPRFGNEDEAQRPHHSVTNRSLRAHHASLSKTRGEQWAAVQPPARWEDRVAGCGRTSPPRRDGRRHHRRNRRDSLAIRPPPRPPEDARSVPSGSVGTPTGLVAQQLGRPNVSPLHAALGDIGCVHRSRESPRRSSPACSSLPARRPRARVRTRLRHCLRRWRRRQRPQLPRRLRGPRPRRRRVRRYPDRPASRFVGPRGSSPLVSSCWLRDRSVASTS